MHRRGVLAALAAGMGGLASLPVGTGSAHAPSLDVTIDSTSSPVVGGNRLEVTVLTVNPNAQPVEETVTLYDSSGNVLDSQELNLGETTTVYTVMGYTTYPTKSDVTFPVTARGSSDSDSRQVTVYAADTGLNVNISRTSSPVTGGHWLEVRVALGNGATHEVADTVSLYDSSGTLLDSQDVRLAGESTETISLGWQTYPVKNTVRFPVTVRSGSDSESQQVTVYGTG